VFFFPDASHEDRDLILANGGLLTNYIECFTYQISKSEVPPEILYYPGKIYDF